MDASLEGLAATVHAAIVTGAHIQTAGVHCRCYPPHPESGREVAILEFSPVPQVVADGALHPRLEYPLHLVAKALDADSPPLIHYGYLVDVALGPVDDERPVVIIEGYHQGRHVLLVFYADPQTREETSSDEDPAEAG